MTTSDWVDISWPLRDAATTWPGGPELRLTTRRSCASGDTTTDSVLTMDLHTGSHAEAPAHVDSTGRTVDELPLDAFIGPAVVIDAMEDVLKGTALAELLPNGAERVLLRTRNSQLSDTAPFDPDFAALPLAAAEALAEAGLLLLGADYLSVQRYGDPIDTHRVLFAAGIAILEGLRLEAVTPGSYDLICLPLSLPGREAAPVRAFLAPPGTIARPT